MIVVGLHPLRLRLTAAISSLIATVPSVLASHAVHCATGAEPRLMLTHRISSLIATAPFASQSPSHNWASALPNTNTPNRELAAHATMRLMSLVRLTFDVSS